MPLLTKVIVVVVTVHAAHTTHHHHRTTRTHHAHRSHTHRSRKAAVTVDSAVDNAMAGPSSDPTELNAAVDYAMSH